MIESITCNILLVLLIAVPSLAKPRIPEATILGDWCAGNANAFHEEFSLAIEDGARTFSSWLHQKPAESGTWELRDRRFTIHGASRHEYVYTVVSATRTRLVLRQENLRRKGAREVYLRKRCRQFENPYQKEPKE